MRAIIKMASLAAVVFTAVSAHSVDISKDQAMAIARNGEQAPMMGAPPTSSATHGLIPSLQRAPSTVSAGAVTFQPDARSADPGFDS